MNKDNQKSLYNAMSIVGLIAALICAWMHFPVLMVVCAIGSMVKYK